MKLNLLYIQHTRYIGPSSIQIWANNNGHNINKLDIKAHNSIINPDFYDLLIILGNDISSSTKNDDLLLKDEKKIIDRFLNDGKKVVGINYGSRVLAEVLGAKTIKLENEARGWHKININESKNNFDYLSYLPNELLSFQWAKETSELSKNFTPIASDELLNNHIYSYGEIAVGFQFYIEQNEYSLSRIIERENSGNPNELYLNEIQNASNNNKLFYEFLDRFCK